MRIAFLITTLLLTVNMNAQWAVTLSNPDAADVLEGNYMPSYYSPTTAIYDPAIIVPDLLASVSADSLEAYNQYLETFGTRHVLSDTVSTTTGIGAARRWIHSKFAEFSAANENRLLVGYLDFKYNPAPSCPTFTHYDHRNVFAILPGADSTLTDFLLVEAHMDSRCDQPCDTACYAPGLDDNGSGTALVMELARVMSAYTFDRTIVFTTTTGEELGLWGGEAWAFYIDSVGLDFGVCFNNDIVGGVLCGAVASPPACATPGSIDSTHVRVFSFSPGGGAFANSPHKQLARYIELQQIEEINPIAAVPTEINMMLPIDRTGRGGDHQPFTALGYTAVRFTSANEHGDGTGGAGHLQHTSNDTLLDYNYLARNTVSNGVNLAILASAPTKPTYTSTPIQNGVEIEMTGADATYLYYRVGVRDGDVSDLYWDTVYTFVGTTTLVIDDLDHGDTYFFSVMNVDGLNRESLPGDEFSLTVNAMQELAGQYGVSMSQNYPNPALDQTEVILNFQRTLTEKVEIVITDVLGRTVERIPVEPVSGEQRIQFNPNQPLNGYYHYSLLIDGVEAASRKMVFN